MDYSILKSHINDIQKAAREGNLVVFAGAGVSNNSGVPVWNKLTNVFKNELPEFAKDISDDLKLAQIYKTTYPAKFLETVRSVLKDGEIVPNELRNVIGNDELMIRIGKYGKDVYDNVSKEIKRRIWKVITTNNIESQI